MKCVLVTGGAGFLGSHLCDRLIESGNYVICLDNFFTGSKENIQHLVGNPNFELEERDIIWPYMKGVDEIYNLACPASPVHYQYDPIKTINTSVFGAVNMLELAKGVKAKLLQGSTSEVYGDPVKHPQTEEYWGNVNPIGLRSCYDEGKRCAETLCMDYHRQAVVVVIDMRGETEIAHGAIPGSVAIPEQELLENPPENTGKKLIIVCSRGRVSVDVSEELCGRGYEAYSLEGGYIGWLMSEMKKQEAEEICESVEKSIRKKFHKSIWSNFTKAVRQYELVKEGDRVAVCISGGKDSMLMAKLFQELQRYSKYPFGVEYLVMDPGYSPENRKVIEENARKLNVPITIYESDIFEAVFHVDQSPCYLCARMRRGHLYHYAQELGCNKIALGHHYDDVIETILMGMLYGAQVQTMMPKLHSTNFGGMELIRPMYLIREDSIKAWRDYNDLHFIQCACKFTDTCTTCNNEETKSKRMEIKQLIRTLKKTNPFIESNIFRSVENVNLDTVVGYKQYGERHYFLENYDKMGELKQEELEKKEAAQAVQESFSEQYDRHNLR